MEEQVDRLVNKVWSLSSPTQHRCSPRTDTFYTDLFQTYDNSRRLLIGIGGIPGSGKTTFASTISSRLNEFYRKDHQTRNPNSPGTSPIVPNICASLPLDGYHLTRAELSALPNAEEAHFRRGAAFTFNGEKFLQLVQQLRRPILPETRTIHAPSFDHAKKDPVEDDIAIPPSARIIVIEGNYLALNREPWSNAANLMDELWFVDVPIPVATIRLVKRHVAAGISPDEDHARKRVDESDMRNGHDIVENRLPVQEQIRSVEDTSWAPKSEEDAKILEDEVHVDIGPASERSKERGGREEGGGGGVESETIKRPDILRNITAGSAGSVGLTELARTGNGC